MSSPATSGLISFGLFPRRLALLSALLVLELAVLSLWLDGATLTRTVGFTGLMGDWGPAASRIAVAFAVAFLTFGFLSGNTALERISKEIRQVPIARGWLAGHLCLLIVLGVLSHYLFSPALHGRTADFIAGAWVAAVAGTSVLAAVALVPLRLWSDLIRSTRKLWVYASVAGICSYAAGAFAWTLWKPTTAFTFWLVRALLFPLVSNLVVDPATRTIGSSAFTVTISKECSGLEGAGLMLVFGALWLWFFRQECRFPRALLLIPVSILVLWLANSIRIAALILIGSAGAPSVAVGGFHSQAGWIAFNAVALGFSIAAQRSPWLKRTGVEEPAKRSSTDNPAAPYLVPFLMILAAGMISRAVSSGFEWLYPLRFFGAAAALWFFRAQYRSLDWRVGWVSPVIGIIVFALWLGLDRFAGVPADNGIALGLAAWPAAARFAWLTFRTLAAVVTVPIAEELAFRGFLIRRLISSDFDRLDLRAFTWIAVLVSSVAFGLMHGDRWIAGTAAGFLYAAALLWRGRIGDAVVAHGTTNALIAAWVLGGGHWSFW